MLILLPRLVVGLVLFVSSSQAWGAVRGICQCQQYSSAKAGEILTFEVYADTFEPSEDFKSFIARYSAKGAERITLLQWIELDRFDEGKRMFRRELGMADDAYLKRSEQFCKDKEYNSRFNCRYTLVPDAELFKKAP